MKTYRVKEIFRTLQGEGSNAGRTAIFLRFVGCNLWSGHDKDRERDATRHSVDCPRFCDTDFVGGQQMTSLEIGKRVQELRQADDELLVITGGEPLQQLDLELATVLVKTIRAMPGDREPGWQRPAAGPGLALETNGTVALDPHLGVMLQHITVSPKVPARALKVTRGDELRVPFPGLDPTQYDALEFTHRFVSAIGDHGLAARARLAEAAQFCLAHPRWRLSVQLHKVVGLP